MDESLRKVIRKKAIEREAVRAFPYFDIYGNISIGIGHNLSANPLSAQQIDDFFNSDIDYHYEHLKESFPWFLDLNQSRQAILVYMAFNLGWKRFLGFKKMIKKLEENDFEGAAQEVLTSVYNTQLPKVTHDIAQILISGMI